MRSSFKLASLLLVVLIAASIGFWGCSQTDDSPVAPQETSAGLLTIKNPAVQSVMAVQERHTEMLMASPGVIGTGITALDNGKPGIMVLVTTRAAMEALPREIEGVIVRPKLTEPIMAFKGGPPGNNGPDHQARQDRPIELGVSGGNVNDLANGFCCSGTLGALVQDGGTQYILSNSHVFAGDVASSGGDPDVATLGDPINQPGAIDIGCQDISADYVGELSSLSTLFPPASTPNVDCAIALTNSGAYSGSVMSNGSILEIGTISSTTVAAFVGQDVKKSGRTTGLTRSVVDAINVTVNVGYEDECNGTAFTKQFTGQIIIKGKNKGKAFLAGGDSGSLMVEDENNNPNAVGLLFAGSSQTAVANPIDDVLTFLGVSLVGN